MNIPYAIGVRKILKYYKTRHLMIENTVYKHPTAPVRFEGNGADGVVLLF